MPEHPTEVVYRKHQPVLVVRSALVRVIEGPDAGACCSLELQRVRIGSATDGSLVLTDRQVSRNHLELRVQDQGYLAVDLGSTNGTFYRGARIHEVELGVGAEIRIGATLLRIERGSSSTESTRARTGFGGLVGVSPPMQRLYGLLAAVAPADTTVLIEGETGTGKELAAQAVHARSPRAERLFVVVDCAALPSGLIESELFGHERGSFTGALAAREGAFERCRGGTLFLDEIGELPLDLQSRLLRVLDQRVVKRVGGNMTRRVDVRLVAATNRNLEAEVGAGRFRRDLYYRLAVVRIQLPPLRRRREDIALLARHFLRDLGCADPETVLRPEVLEVLDSRRWRGNVRELRNVIEQAMLLSDGSGGLPEEQTMNPTFTEEEASSPSQQHEADDWLRRALPPELLQIPYPDLKQRVVCALEDLYIRRLQAEHGGNLSRIAKQAGVDRHLVRKVLNRERRAGGAGRP
jgi:DNA-binding NtrC family response regulator